MTGHDDFDSPVGSNKPRARVWKPWLAVPLLLVACAGLSLLLIDRDTHTSTPSASTSVTASTKPSELAPTASVLPSKTSVTAYGALGDGTSDATHAIQAAIDACGTDGGTITFPAGTYLVSSPIKLPAGNVALLSLAGHGATIRLSNRTPRFLVWNTAKSGLTFRHFLVQGFTLDAQGHHPSAGSWSVAGFDASDGGAPFNTNIEDVTVRDVNTINVPTMDNPQTYRAFNVDVYASGTAHITDVLVQGCHLAGGTAGVSIWGADPGSHVTMNRVSVRDCWHDTGIHFTKSGYSENYHIGQYAHVGSAEVMNCTGYNSGDVGVEMNNSSEGVVNACTIKDALVGSFYYTNYATPLNGASSFTWRNDVASVTSHDVGGIGQSGFAVVGAGLPIGTVNLSDCSYNLNAQDPGCHALFVANTASLTALNATGLTITSTANPPDSSMVVLEPHEGAMHVANVTVNGRRLY